MSICPWRVSSDHAVLITASPDLALSSLKTWCPVCCQGGRSPGVLSGCLEPRVYNQTSLAVFNQFIFFMRWQTFVVGVRLLGFVFGICRDFSMAMVLTCVVLMAMVGRSA